MATVQPWYKLPEAQAIFRSIVRNPPKLVRHKVIYALNNEEWLEFTGRRVAKLDAIYKAHLEPLLATGQAIAGGLTVSVQVAVNAAFPEDECIRFWGSKYDERPQIFDAAPVECAA